MLLDEIKIRERTDIMFIIGTAIYAALTIIFIPILLVLIYMLVTNSRYSEVMNIYNTAPSTIIGWIGVISIAYLFLTGFCIGELPVIWTNIVFLICLAGSVFISGIICKVVKFYNKDRIKYGNILLADKQICDKLEIGRNQLEELKILMETTSVTPEIKKINQARVAELKEMLSKLVNIHQELQTQKILLNTAISTKEMKNVVLSDSKSINDRIDNEIDKIESHKIISDRYSSVKSLMKKYNVN